MSDQRCPDCEVDLERDGRCGLCLRTPEAVITDRDRAAMELDDTPPPPSRLAKWKQAEEERIAAERAEWGDRAPLNAGAYGPDAVVENGAPRPPRAAKDPYLGDTVENLMHVDVVLGGGGGSSRRKTPLPAPNAKARDDAKISRYRAATQEAR